MKKLIDWADNKVEYTWWGGLVCELIGGFAVLGIFPILNAIFDFI